MQETAQQYIQRILGFVEGKDPLEVQRSTPGKLAKAIHGLDKTKLQQRPAPEKWSISEILAHLADTELVGGWRLRQVIGKNGVEIQAYDQEVWAETFGYSKREPAVSLETFRVVRAANLLLLQSIPKVLWENYGMHQERGKETVAHIVRMFAGHDLNHLRQIEQVARAAK
jgi:uncharacterized damage-inducible protein DinB